MTCRPLSGGGFACARRETPAPCSVCRKRPHTRLCDSPLHGSRLGETCSRKLCESCAALVDGLDLCPAHEKAASLRKQRNKT